MAGMLRASRIAFVAMLAAGCAPEFDRVSEIETLRVLAVQKDKPYTIPGDGDPKTTEDAVNLSILWRDAPDKAGRPVQVVWLSWCFNPPGDLFFSCFADLDPAIITSKTSTCPPPPPAPRVRGLSTQVDELLARPASGPGPEPLPTSPVNPPCDNKFSLEMPPTILDRPPPSDPTQPQYGLAYVFFAVCAGKLEFRPGPNERDFPFACLDESNNRLGSDDFVAGYSAVYAYRNVINDTPEVTDDKPEVTNDNPRVHGFFFDDTEVVQRCLGDECLDLRNRWSDFQCDQGRVPCVPACEDDGDESCPPHKIRPRLLEPGENLADYPQPDDVSNTTRNRNITEQMWINYYAERGGVKSEVRLLNDAFEGVNDDFGTEFYAPKDPGLSVIWAVVHDNRGGMSWVGTPVMVQAPTPAPAP